jgi:hypothetical protein
LLRDELDITEKGVVCQGKPTTRYGSVLLIRSGASPAKTE